MLTIFVTAMELILQCSPIVLSGSELTIHYFCSPVAIPVRHSRYSSSPFSPSHHSHRPHPLATHRSCPAASTGRSCCRWRVARRRTAPPPPPSPCRRASWQSRASRRARSSSTARRAAAAPPWPAGGTGCRLAAPRAPQTTRTRWPACDGGSPGARRHPTDSLPERRRGQNNTRHPTDRRGGGIRTIHGDVDVGM